MPELRNPSSATIMRLISYGTVAVGDDGEKYLEAVDAVLYGWGIGGRDGWDFYIDESFKGTLHLERDARFAEGMIWRWEDADGEVTESGLTHEGCVTYLYSNYVAH